ncbi:putative carboxylesterase SOBER1-like protein [Cucurbita argyrosperma subsp. argyrosperma]|nr:putative carboxylesterase SOBER1-like protein [Cucurbita argyrosperma subsp. argyrosperma]
MATASVRQQLTKSIALSAATFSATILLVLFHRAHPSSSITSDPMAARSFILWLHGLGDSGPANEPIKNLFTSPAFKRTSWSFPSAPSNPVTCNYGAVMPSWFAFMRFQLTA